MSGKNCIDEENLDSDSDDDDYVPNDDVHADKGTGTDDEESDASESDESQHNDNPNTKSVQDLSSCKSEQPKSNIDALWASFKSNVGESPASQHSKSPHGSQKPADVAAKCASSFSNPSAENSEQKTANSTVNDSITLNNLENSKSFVDGKTEINDLSSSVPKESERADFDSGTSSTSAATAEGDNFSAVRQQAGLGSTKRPFAQVRGGGDASRRGGGFGQLSAAISKKSKLNVLDQSKSDWESFKSTHKISEELQTFNAGKGGYLQKQMFLERSDLRQFENERNTRLRSNRPN